MYKALAGFLMGILLNLQVLIGTIMWNLPIHNHGMSLLCQTSMIFPSVFCSFQHVRFMLVMLNLYLFHFWPVINDTAFSVSTFVVSIAINYFMLILYFWPCWTYSLDLSGFFLIVFILRFLWIFHIDPYVTWK